jgi:hypothetical protein
MITSVKEVHLSISGSRFYTYLICKVRSGGLARYSVYRQSEHDCWKRIGCELPLGYCRSLIRKCEPRGTRIVRQKVVHA